jgi:hypothetical protein
LYPFTLNWGITPASSSTLVEVISLENNIGELAQLWRRGAYKAHTVINCYNICHSFVSFFKGLNGKMHMYDQCYLKYKEQSYNIC